MGQVLALAARHDKPETVDRVRSRMERLHRRVCGLLEEHADHERCCRRDANSPVQHALEFVKMELRDTIETLSQRGANECDMQWLNRLMVHVKEFGSLLDQDVDSCLMTCTHAFIGPFKKTFKLCCCCMCLANPMLLPELVKLRIALCFEDDPLSGYWGIMPKVVELYHCTQDPRRYNHLLSPCIKGSKQSYPRPAMIKGSEQMYPHTTMIKAEPGAALHLVGIDGPVKKLLRWIVRSTDKNLKVVSIVGPAGVGKTTLAMELYHRLQCQTASGHCYFHYHATACATSGSDRNELLLLQIKEKIRAPPPESSEFSQTRTNLKNLHGKVQEIIDEASVKSECFDKWNKGVIEESPIEPDSNIAVNYAPKFTTSFENLKGDIRECLKDKRYFILIDDLWEASDWEQIKGAFPSDNTNCGSQILVTTRVRSVAQLCCSDYGGLVHEMKPLDESDSEKLLRTRAFGSLDGHQPADNKFKEVSDEILRRCEGIPLFITAMADWLKRQQRQGKKLKSYSIKEVPLFMKQFEQALSPAYNELPSEVRLALLYMCMLQPKGYTFEKDYLIMKWLNEGLVQGDFWGEQSHKEAEEYFSKMVDRNIITPVAESKRHRPQEIDACQWHINHFMLQFLTSKSIEMGLVFNTSTLIAGKAPADNARYIPGIPRWLAHHHADAKKLQTDLSKIRSLAMSGAAEQKLDRFTYLVVLDLEGWMNLKDEDLLQICSNGMCLLVFLSIRNTGVSKLPRQIKNLCSLRTLDISHTQISELPLEVCDLEYLFKFDLRGTQIRLLPNQIARLRCLQDLLIGTNATLDLSLIEALGELENLRVLAITWSSQQCTNGAFKEALLSSIKKWSHLKSLTMHCGLGCNMDFLSLVSDHKPSDLKLDKFKVTAGKFVSVPRWIKKLQHLVFLQITICKLKPGDLIVLADLHRLKCLGLGLVFIPREKIVIGNNGFKMLERLSISCPVPWITFLKGAMLRLAYLELEVISAPARESDVPSGLSNLQCLSKVVLRYNQKWCSNSSNIVNTAKAVKQEVDEHCNPIDLIINHTEYDLQKFDETEWVTKIQSDGECEAKSSYSCSKEAKTSKALIS